MPPGPYPYQQSAHLKPPREPPHPTSSPRTKQAPSKAIKRCQVNQRDTGSGPITSDGVTIATPRASESVCVENRACFQVDVSADRLLEWKRRGQVLWVEVGELVRGDRPGGPSHAGFRALRFPLSEGSCGSSKPIRRIRFGESERCSSQRLADADPAHP